MDPLSGLEIAFIYLEAERIMSFITKGEKQCHELTCWAVGTSL
jgi:hypothetical protein